MRHSIWEPTRRRLDPVTTWQRRVNRAGPADAPGRRASAEPAAAPIPTPVSTDWLALRTWEDDGGETPPLRTASSPLGPGR